MFVELSQVVKCFQIRFNDWWDLIGIESVQAENWAEPHGLGQSQALMGPAN
jgi:hypothetical protein